MKKLLTTLVVVALSAMAQPPGRSLANANLEDVKSALGLSDAQVDQLKQIRTTFAESLQPLRTQLREKMQALRNAQQADNPNASEIAQLLVDIKNLRQQIADRQPELLKQTKAALTPDQLTKLATLEQAQKLQSAVRQAAILGLLAPLEGQGPGERFPGVDGGPIGQGRMRRTPSPAR